MKRIVLLGAFGVLFLGCVPAEYQCPEGLVPVTYTRQQSNLQHSSELRCEHYYSRSMSGADRQTRPLDDRPAVNATVPVPR